jgi:hypothetical protein
MKIFTDFAVFEREGLCESCIKAARKELRQCNRALSEFDEKIDAALAHPNLSARSKHLIRRWWYGDPVGSALSLGNRAVHQAATAAAAAVLLLHAHEDQAARKGRLRFRMLTTVPDVGMTDFEAPVLNFEAICRSFDVSARAARVDALGFMDLAIVNDSMSLEPLRLAAHMHGAIRAMGKSFRAKAAQRAATRQKTPFNQVGLKVVKITSKRRDWGRSLTRQHVAHLAYYVRKLSCGFKVVFSQKRKRKSRTTLHGWNVTHALRQLECLCHCDVLKTTRGVGKGTKWRSRWKGLLLQLLGSQTAGRGLIIDHQLLERQWARIWTELGGGLQPAKCIGE